MTDLYADLSMPRIVNAAGKMTYLGSSVVTPTAVEAMVTASQCSFDMELLKQRLSNIIGSITGSDGGCVTASAASGIVVSIASALTGTDRYIADSLPEIPHLRREIILQRGHTVHFGASMLQMIRLPGGIPVEIGTVSKCEPYHLEGAISDKTAAILYVVSHHTVQNGMLPLEEVICIAHKKNIPVIVDAAAEVDIKKYVSMGADLVVYSGHKAFSAPTSGFICGNHPYIDGCLIQDKGIARAMKVGKENMIGLYQALLDFQKADPQQESEILRKRINELSDSLQGIHHVKLSIQMDATRPIPRLVMQVEPGAPFTAAELIEFLENGDPSIRTRNHKASSGIIQFDPRELRDNDVAIIAEKIEDFVR